MLAVAPAAPASAVPGEGGRPVESPVLGLAQMGFADTLTLYGLQGTQTVVLPVPMGTVPAALEARVELPAGVRGGYLVAEQDGRTLSRTELPVEFGAPVTVPLPGVRIDDNAATLSLRSYLEPVDGYCLFDPAVPLRLADAAVRYDGVEVAPRAIADFLPPVLDRLTVFVPAEPTHAETDAAIRMTTAVLARYGRQPVDLRVVPLDGDLLPPVPAAPLERQIIVAEGAEPGVSLQGVDGVPALVLGGEPGELANQSRLLSSDLRIFAVTSKAVVGTTRAVPQLPPDEATLADIGQPGVSAVALNPQVSIGLDQTRLGRSVRDVRIHLKGSHTPLAEGIGGQLTVAVGGQTVDRWPVTADGVIDRWVDIPDELLRRYTDIVVGLSITGNTGRCGEYQPLTLTIDGASLVHTRPAVPPVPRGFDAVPQALMPQLAFGVAEGSFDDARRAVLIAGGLQRISGLPLGTAVAAPGTVLDGAEPAVLVAADGFDDPRLPLPVTATGGEVRLVDPDGGDAQTLTLVPEVAFGSLQVVYDADAQRSLVVATSTGDPARLDGLLDWLNEDPQRWARLTGDAVLAVAGRAPVMVSAGAAAAPAAADDEGSATLWLAAGAAGVGLVTAAAVLLLRRRRRNSA